VLDPDFVSLVAAALKTNESFVEKDWHAGRQWRAEAKGEVEKKRSAAARGWNPPATATGKRPGAAWIFD